MKHRKIRCLTRVETTDDIKSCYRWRNSNVHICSYDLEVAEHRVPFFLTLHTHLIIEETLHNLALKFIPQLFSKTTFLFYDIIHGLVSSYSMKEISDFWRQR